MSSNSESFSSENIGNSYSTDFLVGILIAVETSKTAKEEILAVIEVVLAVTLNVFAVKTLATSTVPISY